MRFGAYIYARESDPLLQDSNDMQIERGHDYADRIDVPVLRELQDGMSGLRSDRKEYRVLLADAEAGKFSHLILFKVDRISREDREFVVTCHRLMDLGIEIHDTIRGRLRREDIALEAYLSYREVCAISERTSSKMAYLVQKEARQYNRPLLGYRPVQGDPGRREKDPATASALTQAFVDYANGRSLAQVTRQLNAVLGLRKTKGDVRALLRHEYYKGVVVRGRMRKSKIDGYHVQDKSKWQVAEHDQPLVDAATWERVQARLDRDRELAPRTSSARSYALSALVRCASCDISMHGHCDISMHGHKETAYRCGQCGRQVAARRLEEALRQQMQAIPLQRDDLAAVAARDDEARLAELDAEHAEVERRLEKIAAERAGITRKFGRDEIDRRDYQAAMSATQDERDQLEKRLAELETQRAHQQRVRLSAEATVAYLLQLGPGWPDAIAAAPAEDRHACYREVLKRLVVDLTEQRVTFAWSDVVACLLHARDCAVPLAGKRLGRPKKR